MKNNTNITLKNNITGAFNITTCFRTPQIVTLSHYLNFTENDEWEKPNLTKNDNTSIEPNDTLDSSFIIIDELSGLTLNHS